MDITSPRPAPRAPGPVGEGVRKGARILRPKTAFLGGVPYASEGCQLPSCKRHYPYSGWSSTEYSVWPAVSSRHTVITLVSLSMSVCPKNCSPAEGGWSSVSA